MAVVPAVSCLPDLASWNVDAPVAGVGGVVGDGGDAVRWLKVAANVLARVSSSGGWCR